MSSRRLPKNLLPDLIGQLQAGGYDVVGPVVEQGAVVYRPIADLSRHPVGMRDEQRGGRYTLHDEGSGRWFDFVVGPDGLKRFFFAPRQEILRVPLDGGGDAVPACPDPPRPVAYFGVRPCELAAVAVQDRVLGEHDPHYWARRQGAFFVAVQCVRPGEVCFCASMDTGPQAPAWADIALTELEEDFVAHARTDRGREVLQALSLDAVTPELLEDERDRLECAEDNMGRHLNTDDLPGLLLANLEHPRWDDVADRCLSCTNCTMACPTCFCSAVEDHTDLLNDEAVRERRWDSCFAEGFSHMHGGSHRPTVKARYRQWLTHKLDSWHEQFGTSGCVGCGRCITWCPVGIDLTEEVAAIRGDAP